MIILQINLFANLWSTGKIAADIGEAVIGDGGESYLAYGLEYKDCNSHLIQITGSEFLGKIHFYLFSSMLDLPGWGSWFETKKLIKKIKKIKPDVIHLHHIYFSILNINVLFCYLKKANIPVVWTFHDCWAVTGGCSYFTLLNCDKWKTQCHDCPRFVRTGKYHNIIDNSRFNYNHKKWLFNGIKNMTITTVSEWLKSVVEESFLSKYPIRVITNGVNTEVFYPRNDNELVRSKYGINGEFIIISVASHWGNHKGLSDLLQLRQKLVDDYVIVLVGLSDYQIAELPKGIIGIRRTSDQNELASLYSLSDVVLGLSYQETFGLTIAEGFACGTPAIVYNNTALPEFITPQVGFLVETGNIDQVIFAIQQIRAKGKSEFSNACRERANYKYPNSLMLNQYLQLYNEITTNEKS